MSDSPKLAILLSTYNGGEFLQEQLDSLFQQSYTNFVLVIRDDGSTDNTPEILQRNQAEHPDQVHVLSADHETSNLGASASFSYLVDYVLNHKSELGLEHAYMFFCDQDDVWFEQKIAKEFQCMQQAEARLGGSDKPVLVHSDLRVVDENKALIAESFVRYQGLEVQRNGFCNIAISNLVTGCTALINEALARRALPVPAPAIMHDWWMAMVATAFGELHFIDEALVHYRQHGRNTIGAKEHQKAEIGSGSLLRRLLSFEINEHLLEVGRQAAAFSERYQQELSTHDRKGLNLASRMATGSGIMQRIFYRRARRY